ncbi:hypothetical protein [Pelomonas sp. BJYL3]|uniref:hypothetical protein n=1 Tax=Pelomonas sp. BJYL3 TaxID=2976697 RepID=UPI0022B52AE0|nr:hypothetical protein [Pelomonas sp. BJYL3]
MSTVSGPTWVQQFPTSTSVGDLSADFSAAVSRFIAALRDAGAQVSIAATLRPPERAYLMHYAWRIAQEQLDPATVPAMDGVDIDWTHRNSQGQTQLQQARQAAAQMVTGYGIVYRPALSSRHTEGRAIDMNITQYLNKSVNNASGQAQTLTTAAQLHALGAGYGVHKLASDPPHWSDDGH